MKAQANTKKPGLDDRLTKLQEKLDKMKFNQGGGYFNPKKGNNKIRILPEVGDMDLFFQPVGTHRFPDETKCYCPAFTSDGDLKCPICEYVDKLYKGSESEKLLAGQLRVQKKYWINIIDRENEANGPVIMTAGWTIFNQIISLATDPDWGMNLLVNDEQGVDLNLIKEGDGLDTKYTINPTRRECPLHKDPKIVDEWLDKARDLSFVEVSDDPTEDKELSAGHAIFVLPYQRIIDSHDFMSYAEMDIPEEEPKKPAKKDVAKPAVKKGFKKIVEEVVEEDDDEDIYDEDEEIEEEVLEAKNPARQRMAERRASRK